MLEVKGLTKWYEGARRPAVSNLSFDAKKGEILGLLGTNGAGKTTTLSVIAGLLQPTRGDILVSNFAITRDPLLVKERIGYMPENPHLYERLTGREFLLMLLDLRGISREPGEKFIHDLGVHIEIYEHLDTFISTYSKGMIQKVAFMGAVMHRPRVLLLDEPLSGIDPLAARKIRRWLVRYVEEGHSVILSTHIIDLVEKMCDRVVMLHVGHKVEEGTIEGVVERAGKKTLEDAFIKIIEGRKRSGHTPAVKS